ncbi:phosphatase [Rhizobium leguminosarum]|uniref:metallophosphoesterase n=1 Tax=Rhizobium leguminosarum TaxID=384 RepID=UPI001C978A42|nr:metallophosphoesterase [Rhizobium leguminosarum]MBY5819920.1 phosphatase [Rhizobium leguminosarum]
MKAAVISDLHLRHGASGEYGHTLPNDVDVVILAGDIAAPVSNSIQWAHRNFVMAGYEVILVAGNHEHYEQCFETSMADGLEKRSSFPGVHFLENEQVVIGGVRFLGATLWTDFNLYQDPLTGAMHALRGMNDYRAITSISPEGSRRDFVPYMTADMHDVSVRFLMQSMNEPFDGPTVVVTHHAPHPLSVAAKYAGDDYNPSFASDLSNLIGDYQPEFWIHGHTHTSFDYVVPGTKTRVVCNPRGYLRRNLGEYENREFDPVKVIAIPLLTSRPIPEI